MVGKTLSEAAMKTLLKLRRVPGVKLQRTAGLGLALAERATRGSKTYNGTNPFLKER